MNAVNEIRTAVQGTVLITLQGACGAASTGRRAVPRLAGLLASLALAPVRSAAPRAVDAVLDRVDLTALVIRAVDLDRVALAVDVDAIAARLDLDAVVARLDLIGLAGYVVDGIDLPQLVRESSAPLASEGVWAIRMRSIDADQALGRLADRLRTRHRRHGNRDRSIPDHDHGLGGRHPAGTWATDAAETADVAAPRDAIRDATRG